MEKTGYYSITVRKFTVLTRHMDWMVKTQELYNEVLGFYYNLYLDVYAEKTKADGSSGRRQPSSQNTLRELEKLTIVGRDRQPVPYPIPWDKIPLYFRRSRLSRRYMLPENLPEEIFSSIFSSSNSPVIP